MKLDFLIIGQGLAGSLLAWELIQRGCQVLVIDNGKENASQVAAGLINPVTGMRFVKQNDIEDLLPAAQQYYAHLTQFFRRNFYIEKPMLRVLKHQKEIDNIQKRFQNPAYQPFLGKYYPTTALNAPFGILEQKQTGHLLTQALLEELKQYFIQHNNYQKQQFNYAEITHHKQEKIIFCEGFHAQHNPYFSGLPFQAVKGEILTLEHATSIPHQILNYGHWMLPLNEYQFRTGATFDREQLDTITTQTGKESLLNSLKKILPQTQTAKVINHQANVRPCTLDKQPFIGSHPHYKNCLIFNGFGAKGSLQIPYYCQHFADHLLTGKSLNAKVDIQRYSAKLHL